MSNNAISGLSYRFALQSPPQLPPGSASPSLQSFLSTLLLQNLQGGGTTSLSALGNSIDATA
jgi:hypothetical protein